MFITLYSDYLLYTVVISLISNCEKTSQPTQKNFLFVSSTTGGQDFRLPGPGSPGHHVSDDSGNRDTE